MGSLSNLYISASYTSLAHLGTDNALSIGTMTLLQDGIGQSLNISFDGTNISSSGNIYGANITGSQVNTGSLVTTSSFNSYTSSTNARLSSIETTTASLNISVTNINSFTSSQNTKNTTLSTYTASVNTKFDAVGGSTASLNAFTASQQSFNASATASILELLNLSSSLSGGFVTEGELAAATGSLINQINTKLNTSSFNAYTQSNDNKVDSLINATSSYAISSSVALVDYNQQQQINSLIAVTASFLTSSADISSLNAFTASQETKNSTLASVTASFSSSINQLNASSASQQISINALNTNSASVNTSISALNTFTASQSTASLVTSITNLNTFTSSQLTINSAIGASTASLNTFSSSVLTQLNTLANVTSSLISKTGSYATTGSNNFIGDQTITGNITAFSASFTYLQTIFESSSIIYSSGSNQFGDELTDVQTLSGSVKVQGSLTVNGTPVLTSSVDISGLVTTASFNAYTSSNNQRVSSLESNSASVNISISNINSTTASLNSSVSNLNQFTASQTTASIVSSLDNLNTFSASTLTRLTNIETTTASLNSSVSNINSFTQSANQRIGSLEAATSSYVTSAITASSLITASANLNTITFTKGDASTFNITVNTGSAITTDLTSLNAFTQSQYVSNSYFATTASFNSYTQSTNIRLNNLESTSASVNISISNLNSTTSSFATSITNLNTATQSLFTSASLSLTTASVNLNTITFTKGDTSTFNIVVNTGSVVTTDITALNSFTASQETKNSTLASVTSSLNTATASLFTSASLGLVTASFSGNTLTFTKGDKSTFGVVIPDISGSTINTGSFMTTGSVAVNVLTFTKGDGTTFDLTVAASGSAPAGTVSSSAQIVAYNIFATTGSNTFSGSQFITGGVQIKEYIQTGPEQLSLEAEYAIKTNGKLKGNGFELSGSQATEALNIFYDNTRWQHAGNVLFTNQINYPGFGPYSYSGSIEIYALGGANLSLTGSQLNLSGVDFIPFSASVNSRILAVTGSTPAGTISSSAQITSLGFVSSSITASSLITASFSGNTLTFTKGDASTFGVVIPDVSGSNIPAGTVSSSAQILNYNIFATTGSNRFTGSQTITGSQFISGGVVITGQIQTGPNQLSLETEFAIRVNGKTSTESLELSGSNLEDAINSYYPSTRWQHAGDVLFTNQINTTPPYTNSGSIQIYALNGANLELTGSQLVLSGVDFIPFSASLNTRILAVTGSSIDTGSFVTTSSFNSYTTSVDSKFSTIGGLTGSFATTGSNTFTGIQTFQDAALNATSLVSTSGSLMLVAKTFTSASAHLSASAANFVNLIFKNNSNTSDTIISGSNNIFTNPASPTTGYKRYIGGSNNLYLNNNNGINSQITASAASVSGNRPTMNNNIFQGIGAFNINQAVNTGTHDYSQNYYNGGTTTTINALGFTGSLSFNSNFNVNSSITINAASASVAQIATGISGSGTLSIQTNGIFGGSITNTSPRTLLTTNTQSSLANVIAGGSITVTNISSSAAVNSNNNYANSALSYTNAGAAGLGLHTSLGSITNNYGGGTIIASGSAVNFNFNTTSGNNLTLTNQAFSGSLGVGQFGVVRNIFYGQSGTLLITGSVDGTGNTPGAFTDNAVIGKNNTIFSNQTGAGLHNSFISNVVGGEQLIISASNSFNSTIGGGAYFGRYNANDGVRNKTGQTVFSVGTGTSTTRKTGLLIDSGSNMFVEGTLNVSGSTAVTGAVSITQTLQLASLDPLPSAVNGTMAVSGSNLYFASGSNWVKVTLG